MAGKSAKLLSNQLHSLLEALGRWGMSSLDFSPAKHDSISRHKLSRMYDLFSYNLVTNKPYIVSSLTADHYNPFLSSRRISSANCAMRIVYSLNSQLVEW
jgi:hypothetical protein